MANWNKVFAEEHPWTTTQDCIQMQKVTVCVHQHSEKCIANVSETVQNWQIAKNTFHLATNVLAKMSKLCNEGHAKQFLVKFWSKMVPKDFWSFEFWTAGAPLWESSQLCTLWSKAPKAITPNTPGWGKAILGERQCKWGMRAINGWFQMAKWDHWSQWNSLSKSGQLCVWTGVRLIVLSLKSKGQ